MSDCEDSDYLTSTSDYIPDPFSPTISTTPSSRNITPFSPSSDTLYSPHHFHSRMASPKPAIPQPPFSTPPKLQSVEQVLKNNQGTNLPSLRTLTTALARDAIFGRDEMLKCSLSGRKQTKSLDQEKMNYIKTLVRTRVPDKAQIEFELLWASCRLSLSKCCQSLRTAVKKKL